MGNFLAVTAFKTDSAADLMRVVPDYMKSHGVPCEVVPVDSPLNHRRDAQIYAPVAGWTVILWPEYFNIHDFPLVRTLAASQGWLVSTVHVYDDEYWEHLCCSGGTELHAFCSRPRFWEEESPDDFQRMSGYDTKLSRVASALGISSQAIQPYVVDVDSLPNPEAKAHHDDASTLGDFWVFVDFWRRMGITYPTPPQNLAAVLRLGLNVSKALPVG
ncbi:MAG: hypothetical protein H8K09_12385 [Nitrospira sp.]|nr:hypothetical protein [Nitrospira sp.]